MLILYKSVSNWLYFVRFLRICSRKQLEDKEFESNFDITVGEDAETEVAIELSEFIFASWILDHLKNICFEAI